MGFCVALAIGLAQTAQPALSAPRQEAEEAGKLTTLMEELEQAVPAVATMHKHDPESYRTILDIVAAGVSQRKTPDQIETDTRAGLVAIFQRKLPYMPDDLVLDFIRLAAEEGRILAGIKPELCASWVQRNSNAARNYLTPEIGERELALQVRVIRTAPLPAPRIATEEQFSAHAQALVETAAARTGLSVEAAEKALGGEINGANACLVMANFLEAVAGLPDQQGAPWWRRILLMNKAGE